MFLIKTTKKITKLIKNISDKITKTHKQELIKSKLIT